ncbi:MAG: hypothetical protein Aurels2KO_30830 [Aureliella sp.]
MANQFFKTPKFEPPGRPTAEDCSDALKKGLGRAGLWAESQVLDPTQLARAFTSDLRYDRQCEDSRASWLWMLMDTAGLGEVCEDALWQAPLAQKDAWNTEQLCELSLRFSLQGRDKFKLKLVRFVEDSPLDGDLTLGEKQLMIAAGLDGFAIAARRHGRRLRERSWDWDDDSFIECAAEIFGSIKVSELLENTDDDNIRRLNDQWRAYPTQSTAQRSQVRAQQQTLGVVLAAAKTNDRCTWFRGWGMHADQDAVDQVYKRVLETQDQDELSRLLRVFTRRELPAVAPEVLEYCQSPHRELALSALRALQGNADHRIRQLALDLVATGDVERGIELLTSNFETGDEQTILQALIIPDEAEKRHGLLMACRSFLEGNQEASADPLASMIYYFTPCSLCRAATVKLLKDQGSVPAWMVNELRLDSEQGAREIYHPESELSTLILDARMKQLRAADC